MSVKTACRNWLPASIGGLSRATPRSTRRRIIPHLQEDFVSYINSAEAQEILRRHIQTIIADGGGVSITQEQIQELIQRIFKGYQAYLIKMGYTDPEQFDAYLAEYLQTEEAVQIINDWISEVMQNNGNIEITSDQLTALATELSNGYLAYVKENGLPDPTEMGQHFIAYLNTADGQQRLKQRYHKNRRSRRTAVPGFFCAHKTTWQALWEATPLLSPRFCRHRSLPRWNR